MLIAGHIKPWRSCDTANERLDGNNGLMFTPDADLLFDRGFISFDERSKVIVSPRIDHADLKRLGFDHLTNSSAGSPHAYWVGKDFAHDQQAYISYHREKIFME